MRYVGLDAHLRQSTFCVLNDRRRKIVTRTVKGTWASVFYLSFSWRAQPSRAWQRVCIFGHDANGMKRHGFRKGYRVHVFS